MDKEHMDFSGKVALVTGGTRGLGKEVARALGLRGAHVIICSRKLENVQKAQDELRAEDIKVNGYVAHVGKSEEITSLFKGINELTGKLDVLVNNVGMNILTSSVVDADEALWNKIIDTNLKSVYLVSREAVKLMRKQGRGKIINISSIAARKSAPGMGIYCVAKAGVEMLTRVLATELAREKINVNAVAPCMVRTDFSKFFWNDENMLKEITKTIPMGRIAESPDVVGAVLYLASRLSDYVTGEIITVDGGSMA